MNITHTGYRPGDLAVIRNPETQTTHLGQFNSYNTCEDFCYCYWSFFGTEYTYRHEQIEVVYAVDICRVVKI